MQTNAESFEGAWGIHHVLGCDAPQTQGEGSLGSGAGVGSWTLDLDLESEDPVLSLSAGRGSSLSTKPALPAREVRGGEEGDWA